ncbi:hypothetical protein MXB_4133 [Myxobolus squamalis]|nr:hypothetical protein MXB_4133 [Myxobolus squamalis]
MQSKKDTGKRSRQEQPKEYQQEASSKIRKRKYHEDYSSAKNSKSREVHNKESSKAYMIRRAIREASKISGVEIQTQESNKNNVKLRVSKYLEQKNIARVDKSIHPKDSPHSYVYSYLDDVEVEGCHLHSRDLDKINWNEAFDDQYPNKPQPSPIKTAESAIRNLFHQDLNYEKAQAMTKPHYSFYNWITTDRREHRYIADNHKNIIL